MSLAEKIMIGIVAIFGAVAIAVSIGLYRKAIEIANVEISYWRDRCQSG